MTDLHRRGLLALGLATGAAAGAAAEASAAETRARQLNPGPTLTPAVTEGPYYLAGAPARGDIREGLPGLAVELRFHVFDETGAPLPLARVDVWHCDAQGRYSGFGDAPGREPPAALKAARFLRGVQPVDDGGVATFRTVYPGWYEGRTTHIHYKVWLDGRTLLTSQVFLPDALNEFLYLQAADYRRERARDTLNRNDGIARQGGEATFAAVAQGDDRFRVDFDVVVDRQARPRAEGGSPGGPPPGLSVDGLPPDFPGEGPGGGPGRRPSLTGEARVAALLPKAST
ncbi:intradiol ring-cleavage dioxygenase [Caulobacter sp. RL271]|jgi:protocatechuate 3,4-dioxygenase beta subunit|uniref:Intradiol ring-cleavage dioxygenase n=1 Tax=Caulobacter segnis TaxID=88688 RepID=A0ABY4ZW84_9CAUL|nr:intradiol ring-cleavage dioxygenase [Caulobacter segnis]USQ97087.1 intradiol ring-cleavage dioxygenase [Caulobacter segnis]